MIDRKPGGLWWAYLHTNGEIRVKHYFDSVDLVKALQSDFVQRVNGPFVANGLEDAKTIAAARLG